MEIKIHISDNQKIIINDLGIAFGRNQNMGTIKSKGRNAGIK